MASLNLAEKSGHRRTCQKSKDALSIATLSAGQALHVQGACFTGWTRAQTPLMGTSLQNISKLDIIDKPTKPAAGDSDGKLM